jgi:hypothetical protein
MGNLYEGKKTNSAYRRRKGFSAASKMVSPKVMLAFPDDSQITFQLLILYPHAWLWTPSG